MTPKSVENESISEEENNSFFGGLLGLKITYFFLFGSYGAIWPYLALYFRQNGLNAGYVGIIAGVRPMIQFISCPFWAVIADKYKASRIILNMSIISWLVMTVFLFIPKPSTVQCPNNLAKNLSATSLYDSPEFHNKSLIFKSFILEQ
uniref:Major facilitator superfamily domain-containing protein 6 (Trinotate prediction) n=1 Tax=Henneguya salminicola TaxID=69463 RepID=A0A6G3MM25_HENSL